MFFGLLYIIWFIVWQVLFCRVCKPKRSAKPNWGQIIFYLIANLVMIAAGFFITVGFASVTSVWGMHWATEILTAYFDSLQVRITGAMSNSAKGKPVYAFASEIDEMREQINSERTSNEVTYVRDEITDYKEGINNCAKWYLTPSLQTKVSDRMNEKFKKILDIIDKVTTSNDDFANVEDALNLTFVENMGPILEQIPNVTDDCVAKLPVVTEANTTIKDVYDGLLQAKTVINDYMVTILAVVMMLFWLMCLAYCFFGFCCRNKCTRCLSAVFPSCALIVSILVLGSTGVAAVGFVFLNDSCNNFPRTAASWSPNLWKNVSLEDQASMIRCSEEQNLFSLGLSDLFDYESNIVDRIGAIAADNMDGIFDISKFDLDLFKDFGEGIDFEAYLTAESITGYKEMTYGDDDDRGNFTECVETKRGLGDMRWGLQLLDKFWGTVYYELLNISLRTQQLDKYLATSMNETVQSNIEVLTCRSYKCAYSQVEVHLCYYAREGFAWWTIGGFISIFAFFLMTFLMWLRRNDILAPQVEPAQDEEEEEEDETKEDTSNGQISQL